MFWNFADSANSADPSAGAGAGGATTAAKTAASQGDMSSQGDASKPVKPKNDFGGSRMSGDLSEWCAVQLKKLNNSDDLTLIHFCMTLDSPAEVREYLAAYLGSTPQVSQFATDFLKRRDGRAAAGAGAPPATHETVSAPKAKSQQQQQGPVSKKKAGPTGPGPRGGK